MTRDIQNVKDDIVEMKRAIKQILINDRDILEVLNNPAVDIENPDEFLDTNIFSFVRIPQTQDTVKNYICFTVIDKNKSYTNEVMKTQYVQFYAICHLSDMRTKYGVDRHDLLGYLIRDVFNYTNKLGLQAQLLHNQERSMDNDYYCRILDFEITKPNSLNKAQRAKLDELYDL